MSAKDARAGGAYVEVSLRSKISAGAKQVQRELSAVSNSLNSLGGTLGKIGAGISTAGALSAAAFVPAISAAGDFAEVVSKFETVFGDQASAVRAWANEYGNAVGRSERQLLQMLGTAQDTFVPLGFNPKEAEEFSKQIAKLAIDLASFNNMSDQEAFDRLISSVVGNSENLRAFGVVAQDAQIKAEAFAMGLDPKNLTAQQKALAILNLAMKGTTAAQGDATRTADSYANQMKALNAELENTKIAVGEALIGPVTTVIARFREITKAAATWAKENPALVQSLAGISIGAVAIGGVIASAGAALIGLGMAVGSIAMVASAVASAVSAIGALAGVTTVAGAATAAMAAIFNPVTWVVLSVSAALAGLATVIAIAAVKSGVAAKAIEYLKQAFRGLVEIASKTFGGLSDALASGDMQSAAKILFLGLKVAFMKGLQELVKLFMNRYTIMGKATASIVSEIARMWLDLPRMIMEGVTTIAFNVKAVLDTKELQKAEADLQRAVDEAKANRARLGEQQASDEASAKKAEQAKKQQPVSQRIDSLRSQISAIEAAGKDQPQYQQLDSLRKELEGLEQQATEAYDERIKTLREEVITARSNADVADLLALRQQGVTDAQLAQISVLQQQRRELKAKQELEDEQKKLRKEAMEELKNDGKALAEAMRTPREAFVAELARIQELRNANAIDQVTANRAIEKARQDLASAEQMGTNTLATRGSKAAAETIRRNQAVSAETWVTPLVTNGLKQVELQQQLVKLQEEAVKKNKEAMDLKKLEKLSEDQLKSLGILPGELQKVAEAIRTNQPVTYTIP